MWGQIVGGAVAGIVGGEYNKQAGQDAAAANAEAARVSAVEQRAARKEAPDDALNYFNKIAPDSSQFERLGVSGSAVGSVVSNPTQSAIARGVQRTQAAKQQTDIGMQKASIMQNAVQQTTNQVQAERQSQRQAKVSVLASAMQQGMSPKQSLEMSRAIENDEVDEKSVYMNEMSPKLKQDIQNGKTENVRKKMQTMLESGKLGIQEEKLAQEYILTGNSKILAKMGLVFGGKGDDVRDYTVNLGQRQGKRNKFINKGYGNAK